MYKLYLVNAFTRDGKGGNPAAVILDADSIPERDMQSIAAKSGSSKTAFVMRSKKASFKARFFTPCCEVDLSGNAVIAAFFLLAKKGILKPGNYSQETKAGMLAVSLKKDKSVFMEQEKPLFGEIIDKSIIADSLNISLNSMMYLPMRIVSTGVRDIMVPLRTLWDLCTLKPDFRKIDSICSKYNCRGYHVFTLDTMKGSTAHCRNFAPLYGIPEESATGTSSGSLACYLYKQGMISSKLAEDLRFEQGYKMGMPSEVRVSLKTKKMDITSVFTGGNATFQKEITL